MKTFTAWGQNNEAHTMVEGEEPPTFEDGEVQPDCEELIWKIMACSREEAMAIYHLRQGWEPYQPFGVPAPCPACNETYYPEDSGLCWKCETE